MVQLPTEHNTCPASFQWEVAFPSLTQRRARDAFVVIAGEPSGFCTGTRNIRDNPFREGRSHFCYATSVRSLRPPKTLCLAITYRPSPKKTNK